MTKHDEQLLSISNSNLAQSCRSPIRRLPHL